MPNCPYCSKAFGRISALQNHSAFCAIRHQGKYAAKNSTDELDIPPLRDMYIVLQKLVLENEKLHKKITELEKLTNKEKKRVSLVDWLDVNKTPTIDFVDWVKNIVSLPLTLFTITDSVLATKSIPTTDKSITIVATPIVFETGS